MKIKTKIGRVVTMLLLLIIVNASFSDSSEWAAFQASGENAIENKNYSDAEKLFRRALSLAKENYKKTKRHAKTLYFMGKLKMLQKDPVKAIGLYEQSLKMYRRQYGKKHNKTLAVMESLAQARIESGKPHYAAPLYRKIIAAKSEQLSEKHPEVVALLAKLATLLLTLDEPKKAVPVYKKVLAIGKQTKMDSQLLARLYDEYGQALRQTGNSKDAEIAESNAIQLRSNSKETNGFVVMDKSKSSSNANTNNSGVNAGRNNTGTSGTGSLTSQPSTAQASTSVKKIVKGEYKEPAGIKKFRKSMVSKKRYGVSEEYMHALCKDTRTARGLNHCIVYWFTSPNKNIDNVYPRLTVRLFEFKDNKGALAAQQSLRKGANPNTGLNYEWNNVTVNDNWMYWVSAACTYSTSDWKALVADFKATMNVAEKQALVCRCEGGCSG